MGKPTGASGRKEGLLVPHRPKKRTCHIDAGLPIDQPPGEDFFLASVVITDSTDPCWNGGYIVIGNWQTVSRGVSLFLDFDPRARESKVQIFQGENARERFLHDVQEEARYQQQKRSQPNN
jgi:hypothetical protein